ncbi:serine hydrolase [Algibacter sp.]|uniref:serine hydrolase n=1 Tax=Algibacter sp. TaxID=1872428 RepID=UPI003C706756
MFCFSNCKDQKENHKSDSPVSQKNEFQTQIDNIIQDYLELDIFSGVVLVADKGEVLFHQAYGLANRSTNIANSTSTLFDIGSMNKTFTSIVIKQLENEGKLNLEDNLTDYIDGFEDPKVKHVTINHLLSHTSGFGDYHTPDYFDLPKNKKSLQSIIDRAKTFQLNFEPGSENDYSNLGYVILGGIIEKVTGTSYFTNVKDRIVNKLSLKNTYLNDFTGLGNRIATGYYYSPLGELEVSTPAQDVPNPDGGFLSTTEDAAKFYRSYYNDTVLLSKEMKASDPFFQYLKKMKPGEATSAAGGFEGFNSALFQIIDEDKTIVVFANMDEPVAERIAIDVLSTLRGEVPNKPELPALQSVRKAYEKDGINYVKSNFNDLTTNFHPTDPKDIILNDLGYAYLYEARDITKAVEMFKLNIELFPDIANCYDSYGEALLLKGDTINGIKAYKKALEINPKLPSAIDILNELNYN